MSITFTRQQVATLHTLLTDHHAQEALLIEDDARLNVWLYDSDDWLLATATVDDLGGIRMFEWLGVAA